MLTDFHIEKRGCPVQDFTFFAAALMFSFSPQKHVPGFVSAAAGISFV
jgi:hypothetical protein